MFWNSLGSNIRFPDWISPGCLQPRSYGRLLVTVHQGPHPVMIAVSPSSFQLLRRLIQRSGRTISLSSILRTIGGTSFLDTSLRTDMDLGCRLC